MAGLASPADSLIGSSHGEISWDLLNIATDDLHLPGIDDSIGIVAETAPIPFGRQWGWDASALTADVNHSPPVRCGEPWSIHNTMGVVPPHLVGHPVQAMNNPKMVVMGTAVSGLEAFTVPRTSTTGAEGNLGRDIKCVVPGCTANLLVEREFNLRNKICEFHQRSKVLHLDGTDQRFCQQCTRLHPIDQFDGDRRGCRSRLQRHNKRRRLAGIIAKGLSKPDNSKPGKKVKVVCSSPEPPNLQPSTSNTQASDVPSATLSMVSSQSEAVAEPAEPYMSVPASTDGSPGAIPAEETAELVKVITDGTEPLTAKAAGNPPRPANVPELHLCRGVGCNLCALGSKPREDAQGTEFKQAASHGYGVVNQCVFNFAFKMIGTSPDQLPSTLRQDLEEWMKVSPAQVQGYIRFGCLHLSVDVTVSSPDEAESAAANLSESFMASVRSGRCCLPWVTNPTTGLFPNNVIIAANGAVIQNNPHPLSRPSILGTCQLAIHDGLVHIRGTGLRLHGLKLLCRMNKEFHEMIIEQIEVADAANDIAVAAARIPFSAGLGLGWLEVLHDAAEGFSVSKPMPLLVSDCPLVAAEVSRLGCGPTRMEEHALVKLMQDLAQALHPSAGGSLLPLDTNLSLAGFAASCGWAETMDRILDKALQGCSLLDALCRVEALSGMSLLSSAITSGSVETVSRVLSFMAETGSFELAAVDKPSGVMRLSPIQWAEAQGIKEIHDMMISLRNQAQVRVPSRISSSQALSGASGAAMDTEANSEPEISSGYSGVFDGQGHSVVRCQGLTPSSSTTAGQRAALPPQVTSTAIPGPKCG